MNTLAAVNSGQERGEDTTKLPFKVIFVHRNLTAVSGRQSSTYPRCGQDFALVFIATWEAHNDIVQPFPRRSACSTGVYPRLCWQGFSMHVTVGISLPCNRVDSISPHCRKGLIGGPKYTPLQKMAAQNTKAGRSFGCQSSREYSKRKF
jgi:hypothetical protein